jgi:hypothetical protein
MQQCQSQHIPSETTMDEESSAPKAKVVDQMRYGLAHRPGQRGCLPRAKRGMGPTKVVILSWYQRIFYDTFFWMKWRMVPSHVFFLRYSTDRRWRKYAQTPSRSLRSSIVLLLQAFHRFGTQSRKCCPSVTSPSNPGRDRRFRQGPGWLRSARLHWLASFGSVPRALFLSLVSLYSRPASTTIGRDLE